MLTNEEIRNVLIAVQEHSDCDTILERLENVICEELELKGSLLIEAIIQDDADAVVNAFTGWGMEALLEKAQIIPNKSGSWLGYVGKPDDVVFKELPGEPSKTASPEPHAYNTSRNIDDYTIEYCPYCENEVAIYSKGITACPECGKPLVPCTVCDDCEISDDGCPYGCTGGAEDEFKKVTNLPISKEEIDWVFSQFWAAK